MWPSARKMNRIRLRLGSVPPAPSQITSPLRHRLLQLGGLVDIQPAWPDVTFPHATGQRQGAQLLEAP